MLEGNKSALPSSEKGLLFPRATDYGTFTGRSGLTFRKSIIHRMLSARTPAEGTRRELGSAPDGDTGSSAEVLLLMYLINSLNATYPLLVTHIPCNGQIIQTLIRLPCEGQ